MKSIKQQYIDLKEGRMSQSNFMRNLRMTMPQYVTNVTSFNDAVKILKNKGILTEAHPGYSTDPSKNVPADTSNWEVTNNITSDILKKTLADMLESGEISSMTFMKAIKKLPSFDIEGNMNMTGTTTAKEVAIELVIAAGGEFIEPGGNEFYGDDEDDFEDFDDNSYLREGKTKLTADQVNNDELRMGIRVEMEHTDDPEKAKKIALDHLAENPFYYTQLKLSGVDTKALPSKEKKAIAKKKNETEMIDKTNQMKTPKGVEKIKASANKAHKETNKPEKGIKMMSLVAKTVRGVQKMDATGEKMKKIKEGMEDFVDDRDYDNMDAEYGILRQIAMDAPNYASAMAKLEDYGVDPQLAKSIASEIHPEKVDVADTIFKRNANITKGINAIAKGEDPMNKLKEAIRKMIRQEMFDGRDNMTDTVGRQLDEVSSKINLTSKHQAEISALSPEQKKKLYDELTDASMEVNDKEFNTRAEYARAMKDAKLAVYKKYINI